jgi:F0F1-type ATP synthase membrane subunit b/b'
MDAGVIIAIVIGALLLLALFMLLGRKGRERKLESRRHEAREIRREAELDRAQADKTRAEADAQAAEARRQEALARQRAAEAEEQHRTARDRHLEAASLDPDADEEEEAARFDRDRSQSGIISYGDEQPPSAGAGAAGGPAYDRDDEDNDNGKPSLKERLFGSKDDDESVEHYERTATTDEERERRFARDEQGEVVKDEELHRPRQ